MKHKLLFFVQLFCLIASGLQAQSPFAGRYRIAIFNSKDETQLVKFQRIIDSTDGHAIQCFPPNIIEGYVTSEGEKALKATGMVKLLSDTVVALEKNYSARDRRVLWAWNQRFAPKFETRGEEENRPISDGGMKPGKYQTSDYMMGSVAVGICFVESDGSIEPKTESWTEDSKDEMFFQISKGLEWWAQKGGYRASLSWSYEWQDIKTGYEPVNHCLAEFDVVSQEIANRINKKYGYGFKENEEAREVWVKYVNELRDRFKTDWGMMIIAVPAENDADHNWGKNGCPAVAWAGGTTVFMTNQCDGWGPDDAWDVAAHETAHLFGALDEYEGASNAKERSGLLKVINGNHKGDGVIDEVCVMKDGAQKEPHEKYERACDFTQAQIGWIDGDGDGYYDSDVLGLSKKFNQRMMKSETENAKKATKKLTIDYVDLNKRFYKEDFSGNSRAWDEDAKATLTSGAYVLTDKNASLPDAYEDFSLTIRAKFQNSGEEGDYGLSVYADGGSFFRGIDVNRTGSLWLFEGQEQGVPVESPMVNGNEWNQIKIIKQNGKLTYYVNDKLVKTYDQAPSARYSIDFWASSNARVAFDDLSIAKP